MKIIVETTETFEANCLLKAKDMALQINSIYGDVLKKYSKYMELTPEQGEIVEQISTDIITHFDGLFIEDN